MSYGEQVADPHRHPYSAASSLTYRAVGVRIVTSSSAAVGCSATVALKSALVTFIVTAIATPGWFRRGVADDMAAEHASGGAPTSYISIVPTGELIGDVAGRVTKP